MATSRRLGRGITVGLCIRRQGKLSEGVWDQDLEPASLLGKGRQPIQVVVLPVHRVEVHARCLVDSGGLCFWDRREWWQLVVRCVRSDPGIESEIP